MKKIKTKKIGNARIEIYSSDNWFIILFKYKNFTYELLRSKFSSIILSYFDDMIVTDSRVDIIQFCFKHNDNHFTYFEFNYMENDMNEMEIKLDTFSIESQEQGISGYYDSIDEIKRIYGKESNQIIAECIFENSIY